MGIKASGFVVGVLLFAFPVLAQQGAAPKLDKPQRDLLQATIAAVDAVSAAPAVQDVAWQTHLLRTSDGAHYVAFTVTVTPSLAPRGPAAIYVRLATRPDAETGPVSERSAVMEWLRGMRSEPLVAQKRRGIAFGEMPVYGPGSTAVRGAASQATDLALLGMERERARERREAAEKARRAALEGTADARTREAIYPFEDFSVETSIAADSSDGVIRLRRSVTAGPGEYDLYVAWATRPVKGQPPDIHVVKRVLALPPASTTGIALSSVIVADSVGTRETPYPPDQQSSHPYTIGSLDIVPAADETFTNDQRLAIVFQVVNASASPTGKPDVSAGFQLARVTPSGEQVVGALNPQFYNETTLPADFDLAKGHPLFVAMAAPLKTLARGEYRLRIEATDKLVQRSKRAELTFRIVATPQTLLATAPGAPPFRREDLLAAEVLREAAARLRPAQPTEAMTTALDAARDGKFMELLRDDTSSKDEQGRRSALKGIGLYALGDARIACSLLQQSLAVERNAAALLYVGACRALERNDRDALSAWQEALAGDVPAAIAVPLLVGAHLRLGEPGPAIATAQRLVTNGVPAAAVVPGMAAAHIAEGRHDDAIRLLQPHVERYPNDLDAQYALTHALFAGYVRGQGVGSTDEGRERLRAVARAYVDAKGRNAAAVSEWMEIVKP